MSTGGPSIEEIVQTEAVLEALQNADAPDACQTYVIQQMRETFAKFGEGIFFSRVPPAFRPMVGALIVDLALTHCKHWLALQGKTSDPHRTLDA